MRTVLIIVVLQLLALSSNGQASIPTKTWRSHLSYRNVIDFVHDQKLTAATSSAVFQVENGEITTINKQNGLSDVNINSLGISQGLVIVGYRNGNIDVLNQNEITNYPVIVNSAIPGSKSINGIVDNGSNVLLLTDFGVIVFDPENGTVVDSYLEIGTSGEQISIFDGTIVRDSLFLATEEGVIAGLIDGSVNLKDFRNWRRYDAADGLPLSNTRHITSVGQQVYVAFNGVGFFEYDGGAWNMGPELAGESFHFIGPGENELLAITNTGLWELSDSGIRSIESSLASESQKIVKKDGEYLIASATNGIVLKEDSQEQAVFPTGPYSNDNFRIFKEPLTVVSGGFDNDGMAFRNSSGFYEFQNGNWLSYTSESASGIQSIPEFRDITGYAAIANGTKYYSSFGYGLLEIAENGDTRIVNENTPSSLLENITPGERGVNITAIAATVEGLWILNYGAQRPYKFLSVDGSWSEFAFPATGTGFPTDIQLAPDGNLWVSLSNSSGGGVLVFNNDATDFRLLGTAPGQGNLPSNLVNSIRFDKEGQAWIATTEGVAFFPFTRTVLTDSEVDAVIPIFESQLLFDGEDVTCIEIDGGDRKWMAIGSNLWLFDRNFNNIVERFDPTNSPLFNAPITSLRTTSSGELFIGTTAGVLSYQSDASIGDQTHLPKISIFPNPINLRDFSGMVTIKGVADDAIIKITDLSGRLVWQSQANGGTLSWDLRNIRGEIPQTGIYLILSSTSDGTDTRIGKLALVN